jgi:aspartyl-tRNA(Asn)/glutamyl-tRNA(Gln) amidotransferase subunit A
MLRKLTLTTALDLLKKKKVSIDEIYADLFSVLENQNEALNIYLTLAHNSLQTAQQLADKPLMGLPIAVKDNFCTQGLRTTVASTILDTFIPEYDATTISKLKQAGGVVLGKANLDAWAHGSSTETSQYGRTLNPQNSEYLPGGSSGGSAAAVAADLCLAALGTETAGSIRQPAAWCGVVGLKPTYGRVSRFGIAAMASSTDSPGPLAKTVADSALLLNYLAGHDPRDATSSSQAVPDFTKTIGLPIKGLRIGVVYLDIPGLETVSQSFRQELAVFEQLGAHVEEVEALDPRLAIGVYTIVQRGEVSSNLARYDGIRYGTDRSHFGAEAKRRIMLGTYTLSKGFADQYYTTAQKVRSLFLQDFQQLFQKYDVLISPTSPGFAKKVGATEGSAMFGELEDMLLEPSSITGLPGINVPCFRDTKTNLFLGMNIVTPMWREDLCIQVAHAYEQATNWNSWAKQSLEI